jgi:hypothetical protein
VKALIVHLDQLEPSETSRWQHANLAETGLEEVARFGSDVVYKLSPVEATPQLNFGLVLPDQLPTGEMMQLPAGAMMRLGLRTESGNHRPWVHPSPLGRKQVLIRWEEVEIGKSLIQREILELPLVLKAEEVWSTGLPIRTPSAPGHYRLSVDVPTLGLKAPSKLVQVNSKTHQTSANASQSLSAAYVLEAPASRTIISGVIDVTLQATNTGQSIWLADAKDERGKVRLGWRWFRGHDTIPFKEGREDLRYDVFPGQTYQFKTRIKAPLEPGEYTLELGLICELLTWFSDRGVPAFTFAVRVGDATASSPQ